MTDTHTGSQTDAFIAKVNPSGNGLIYSTYLGGSSIEVATAIAAAVQEQGAATQEITRSTQFAAQGTKNVSENMTGVKADADSAAAAAENVKHASETLETQSQHLGEQVSGFLSKIRAA